MLAAVGNLRVAHGECRTIYKSSPGGGFISVADETVPPGGDCIPLIVRHQLYYCILRSLTAIVVNVETGID